ncbi:MAG: hypothetical protein KGJ35_02200 [Patescibacteria group bacterium]|nr:hypothetical protein [Patescibacteria group bacterium]
MKTLIRLFGDEAKTKLLRLFLFNPEANYTIGELAKNTDMRESVLKKTVYELKIIGIISQRLVVREKTIVTKSKKAKSAAKTKILKAKGVGYFLNRKFPYISILTDLMAAANLRIDDKLTNEIASIGKIKLAIASGIFVREPDTRLDLLIVGDEVNENSLARHIDILEKEIGRELRYSFLTTADYNYRAGMSDRLIRDVLDYKYIVLIDKIGFSFKK